MLLAVDHLKLWTICFNWVGVGLNHLGRRIGTIVGRTFRLTRSDVMVIDVLNPPSLTYFDFQLPDIRDRELHGPKRRFEN